MAAAVVVVALGAGTGLADPEPVGDGDRVWLSLGVAGAVAAAVAAGWLRWWSGRPDHRRSARRPVSLWIWRLAVIVLLQTMLAGALMAALVLAAGDDDSGRPAPEEVPAESPPPTAPAGTGPEGVNWPLTAGALLTVVGLVGVVASVLVLRSRRVVDDPLPVEESLAEAMAGSVADLDDLAEDPDHRRAVIRAYARMERALGRCGAPRHRSEAPFEYLERALGELGVGSEPARRLTELFERARFSPAPVTLAMRQAAAARLRDVQHDLAVPA